MNLRQLESFREVMATGSVSEAARNLNRTQPAVSAAIAGLETAIDCKLFERRSGRLHPLPEAYFLFEEAKALLGQLGELRRTMSEVRDTERGALRIASMGALSLFFLPKLIADFTRDRPNIKVAIMNRTSSQVIQSIATQQYDVGVADMGPALVERQNPLVNFDQLSFDCVCAVPISHRLAEHERITVADLHDEAMAALMPDHAIRMALTAAFQAAGATLDLRYEGIINMPLISLVQHGVACAVVDPISAASFRLHSGGDSKILFKPFVPSIPFEIAVATPAHRQNSRLTKAFLDLFQLEIDTFSRAWRDTISTS